MQKELIYFLMFLFLVSCEDVIEVDLPEVETRLVVDGLLRVDKDQEFIDVRLTLRETSNFFEENQPTQVENAVIYYGTLNENNTFETVSTSQLVEETPGTGIYVPDANFGTDQRIPTSAAEPEVTFILQLTHNGKQYYAQTQYAPTVPVDNLEQGDSNLFGDDETEVIVTFTDAPNEDNYFVFDFMNSEYQVVEDTFFKGQQFQFSYFYDDQLEAGQEITVSIMGATKEYYDFMSLILQQTGGNGGPFQTPVATVKGNVFDITDIGNVEVLEPDTETNGYALGYFGVVQVYSSNLLIE
ncbi:DUF4249 family protein [Flagellimonas zhangzhouensis]|uniref:DUF4249 domain-containing protein n=1 Tax=Flagellimonas zhangzhouensis TaxID=1073328 RepID=A0A1H2RZB6_9FLAO|nr:DUF4249 family protein [Allomuricauda zhangzhouensis]SDQ68567.1 protein of unknown function [Allomuricauda zhangzhouensis]SDW24124.1 protein of unknown function [Allomuricauda zhangzhouensis]